MARTCYYCSAKFWLEEKSSGNEVNPIFTTAAIRISSNPENKTINQATNELKLYQDARYISASEAIWRIFQFNLHEEKPSIQRLQIHLLDDIIYLPPEIVLPSTSLSDLITAIYPNLDTFLYNPETLLKRAILIL
ncbi:5045_t:CDS:2 [Cetraspora pellucida]|uniref:5045_t:CDS:1 n=1 Tax=Cetraspora pellucida TaxID=1433469 RepID=A0ACA9KDR8_9GLOM|nr:5045_t:CDS:2 [Cetraspora pellucida]